MCIRDSKCSLCSECTLHCLDFAEDICSVKTKPPYVCNGCSQLSKCTLLKRIYDPSDAHEMAYQSISESRTGILSNEDDIEMCIRDRGKLGEALAKLAEEDPTFRAQTDQETGQTIIAGRGELHLQIIVDRLLRQFHVEANVGAPQVAYKETITKAVDVDSKYAKQSGGRGQYGHCKVKFEPMDANGEELYKFESTVVGGAIPKEYIPAVGEGIEEAMKAGILGGYPVVGVHANVYDGSYHEVDSSEMAFHIAGSLAFRCV